MQKELFTIELQGHNYAFAFGNIIDIDTEIRLQHNINKPLKIGRQSIRIPLHDACINKGNAH